MLNYQRVAVFMVTSCRLFTFLFRWCWTLFTRRVLVLGRANVKCSLFTAWYCRLPQALVIWVDVGMSDCAIPKCFGISLYPQNIIIYLIYWATNPIISPIRYIYIFNISPTLSLWNFCSAGVKEWDLYLGRRLGKTVWQFDSPHLQIQKLKASNSEHSPY